MNNLGFNIKCFQILGGVFLDFFLILIQQTFHLYLCINTTNKFFK